jgi:SAM-dependent methyltransferase
MRALPPGIQALLIQLAAVVVTIGIAAPLLRAGAIFLPLPALLVGTGLLAALASHLLKLPSWWLPIQAAFLPAVAAALTLNVPPAVYLGIFLVMLVFYWSTFRTRVPLFLSGKASWARVAEHLPQRAGVRFIDLGSGLGGLPLHLARVRPDGCYEGVEIAPAPWLISRVRAWLLGSPVHFSRADYTSLDLASYDVVFAFLSPAAMPALWAKARREMRPGAMLFSLAFPVPGVPADIVVVGASPRDTLYGWTL